jgi:MYXO-CTERM domain-containing protein
MIDTALWGTQGLLALTFLTAGFAKITASKEALIARKMAWAEDFAPWQLRTIGTLEVLAAVGLVVPPVTGVVPGLNSAAAGGLAVLMLGAAFTHVRRREMAVVAVPLLLAALATFVAWGRCPVCTS